MSEDTSAARRIVQLTVIGLAIVGAVYGWFYVNRWNANRDVRAFNRQVDDLFEAFQKFKQIVGEYPRGSNAEIAKSLLEGNNSKRLMILVVKKEQLNAKGEIVDPWGTPLKIYFNNNEVFIRSAGPNKNFEDSKVALGDDYFRSD
jgi:hypothetical protein